MLDQTTLRPCVWLLLLASASGAIGGCAGAADADLPEDTAADETAVDGPDNLLHNGGFVENELVRNGTAAHVWNYVATGESSAEILKGAALFGQYGLRIVDAKEGAVAVRQFVHAKPGALYEVRAWCRHRGGNPYLETITLSFVDADQKVLERHEVTEAAAVGSKVLHEEAFVAPQGTSWARVSIVGGGGALQYETRDWDRITLRKLDLEE